MSPYLFILVMEILSRLLSRAKEGGFIEGLDSQSKEWMMWEWWSPICSLLIILSYFCDVGKENLEHLS